MKQRLIVMTSEEWDAEGTRLFGDKKVNWKFKCPNCGHVQTARDFDAAGIEHEKIGGYIGFTCIGRFIPDCKGEFGNGIAPCNYTNGGLFNIAPIMVKGNGTTYPMFDFARNVEVKP